MANRIKLNGTTANSFTIGLNGVTLNTANIGPYQLNFPANTGSNNQFLRTDGTGNLSWANVSGGSGTPGGANTQVQFNDDGSFGGDANFTFNKTTSLLSVTGNIGVSNGITTTDFVTFNTAQTGNGAIGQLTWNDGDGTLDLTLKGGNTTLNIGTQEYARVYNDEATTLNKGEVVYVFGAQGNRLSVKRAQANVESTSFGTVGLVSESIAAGAEGYIIVSGALYKLNTNGLTAGGAVYLSPSVAGGYTQTKPVAPDQLVVLGWVERVDNTVGSIYVKVDNGYEINELHDVLITSPTAGQALVYNSSNLWVNGNVSLIANGTSNVSIPAANGNIRFSANAANSMIITSSNVIIGSGLTGDIIGANTMNANFIIGTIITPIQTSITAVGTLSTLSISGNANIGNIGVTGVFANTLSATGNANVGNIGATNGVFTNVSGNGANLTGISLSSISNGNSNVVVNANSNVVIGVAGVPNLVTITSSNTIIGAGAGGNITGVGTISITGNIGNANVVTANTFNASTMIKFGVYTVAGKPASGAVGQVISISDSTPGGMLAYWDTTNSRWSYVHDNSAV